jgi:GNAT superfamily N-acetyltransferase
MTTTPAMTLHRFSADSPLFDAALRAYGLTYPEDDPEENREAFDRHARLDGFVGLVACSGDEPVGVGYGTSSYPPLWWHEQLARVVGADHPALQDAWHLVDLAVVPAWQGRGVGGRVHDALLSTQPYPRALIATGVSNIRARRMYAGRGWAPFIGPLQFPGKREAHIVFRRERVASFVDRSIA